MNNREKIIEYLKDGVTIPLSQGKFAIVDKDDYGWLSRFTWSFSEGYAITTIDGHKVKMRRLILSAKKGEFVDHKDGDRLNNARYNIRIATRLENNRNKGKAKGTSSIFKGVCWDRQMGKWRSSITVNHKSIFLGLFNDEHHAALVYDLWAKDIFRESARLNFSII